MITQEQLKLLYDYDESGCLVNKITGEVFGWPRGRYIKGRIDNVDYYEHRLIFLWHHGYMPIGIDHKDCDEFNNKIDNLREANQSQNMGNARYGSLRGIQRHGRKYRVRITGTGTKLELGSYDTLEEAIVARDSGYQSYFGEFTRITHV